MAPDGPKAPRVRADPAGERGFDSPELPSSLIHVTSVDGGDLEGLLLPVRRLGAEKIVVLGDGVSSGPVLYSVFGPLNIQVDHRAVGPSPIVDTIQCLREVVRDHEVRRDQILVNPAPAPRHRAVGLFAGALTAEVRVIQRTAEGIRWVPRLGFDFDVILGEEEREILEALAWYGDPAPTLEDVVNRTQLSSCQVTGRIRGDGQGKGLEGLGLVRVELGSGGTPRIALTPSGEHLTRIGWAGWADEAPSPGSGPKKR